MSDLGFSLFHTVIGSCGIAWRSDKLVGVQLPEFDRTATRARLRQRFPRNAEAAPPANIQNIVDGIVALLEGERRDFADVDLDMDRAGEFERRVYRAAIEVSAGETITYGEIARRCGDPGAAQAVGRALGRNPFPIVVPCHRVVAAGGRIGGFSANGGIDTKRRILAIESRHARREPTLFDRLAGP